MSLNPQSGEGITWANFFLSDQRNSRTVCNDSSPLLWSQGGVSPTLLPSRGTVLSVSNTWHCWWWRTTRDVLLESTAVPWLISSCLLIHLDVKSCVSRYPAKTEPHQLPCRLWNGEPWARCSVIAKEKEWIHRPSASFFPPRVTLPEPSYCCQQNRETCLPLVWHTRWGKWNPESFLCLSSKFLKYQASSSSQSAALDW